MSHELDDANPLAGVDLRAWQPPAPPPGQVDAILARLEGTRTDAAPAVEAAPPRVRRLPWIAAGLVLGAAAAVVIVLLARRDAGERPAAPPPPAPLVPSAGVSAPRPAPPATPDAAPTARPDRTVAPETAIELEPPPACNATALLDEARTAGSADQWKTMQRKAAEANQCSPSRMARQFELLAACRLGDVAAAKRRFREFKHNAQLQQVCVGVVDDPTAKSPTKTAAAKPTGDPEPGCDADALLDEARAAGGASQWSQMLAKADASNRCHPSRIARQFALLAACRLGQKARAMAYWKEFETNAQLVQACSGVVD